MTPRRKSDKSRIQKSFRLKKECAIALEEAAKRLDVSQERIVEVLIEKYANDLKVEFRVDR